MKEDGGCVSLGWFCVLNNTVSRLQRIHHCPHQLLGGRRCCPWRLSVDRVQLALSASQSSLRWLTGLIRMMNLAWTPPGALAKWIYLLNMNNCLSSGDFNQTLLLINLCGSRKEWNVPLPVETIALWDGLSQTCLVCGGIHDSTADCSPVDSPWSGLRRALGLYTWEVIGSFHWTAHSSEVKEKENFLCAAHLSPADLVLVTCTHNQILSIVLLYCFHNDCKFSLWFFFKFTDNNYKFLWGTLIPCVVIFRLPTLVSYRRR